MYIDDPIGQALGLSPLTEPLPPPNIAPFSHGASSFKGKKHTEESKKMISEAGMKPCSEHKKQKLRESMLAREQDPEWIARKDEMRAKMSAAKKGKPSTFKGKKMSPESREKCRQSQLKRASMTPETREKISLAAKRQWKLKRAPLPETY